MCRAAAETTKSSAERDVPEPREAAGPATNRDYREAQKADVERQTKLFDAAMDLMRLDPKLSSAMALAEKHKVQFMLVDDVNRIATAVGDRNFRGDAFTIHRVVKHRDGTQDDQHIVCIDRRLASDLGKLAATLQHELYHVKAVHEGMTEGRAGMEVRAFQSSISGAHTLAGKIRDLAKNKTEAERAWWGKVADGIDAAAKDDEQLLQEWRKRKEQEKSLGGNDPVQHRFENLAEILQPAPAAPPV